MFNYIKNRAFTVAETMIVLIILGTLFTVIIPVTLNKHRENINRVKIKKSMAYYEVVFKKLVVDNAIMSDSSFLRKVQTENCDKIKKQFKIIETDGDCIFRSAEDVWWNATIPFASYEEMDGKDFSQKLRGSLVRLVEAFAALSRYRVKKR